MFTRSRTMRRIGATTIAVTLGGVALAAPAAATASRTIPNQLQEQVNAVERTGTVGVSAEVTDAGRTTYAVAGDADVAAGTPVRPTDEFRIGSATKTFVATVVLQLVAEGRLSLDDTVGHWLPGVVAGNGNDGDRITIRELLQHTSGLYEYVQDLPVISSIANYQADWRTTYTPAQLVAIAMRHTPSFAPGAGWSYSSTNYVLLGMVIQKATGHSWQYEVDRRIVRPLGLHHTVVPSTDPFIRAPHMDGYSSLGSSVPAIDTTALNPSVADAAGAIISDTTDLSRFYAALASGRLLPRAQLAEMETTVPTTGLGPIFAGSRYGLGLLWMPLSCGGGYFGHSGDIIGYSMRDGFTSSGRRVVVMAESGDGTSGTEQAMETLVDHELCGTPH